MEIPPKKKAVALAYDGERAPVVSAKGEGLLAERIVEAAREHGIHIDHSPVLVEALSGLNVDEEIPVELYKAVAEIIGYVMSLQSAQTSN